MARSKSGRFETRKLSENELLASFQQGLSTLAHLAKVYDDGHPPICFLIATEVQKLLTENNEAVKLQGLRTFSTVDFGDDTKMINAMHKITGATLKGDPPVVEFVPDFYFDERAAGFPLKNLKFKEWWNDDIIYRASAALPGSPAGILPVNDSPAVPYDKRERINRRDFVNVLRNKLGAHQASDFPMLLDEIDDSRSWSEFVVETPSRVFSTEDGSLKTSTSNTAAMMRQICHEVLVAYDRSDEGPRLRMDAA